MTLPQPHHSGRQAPIWDRFRTLLRDRGVKDSVARWHVFRAEQFLKEHPSRSPDAHSAEDVAGYLRELGRKTNLEDWQYRQAIEALEVLFGGVLALPWAATFDWSFWRDSARRLESQHATIARGHPRTPRERRRGDESDVAPGTSEELVASLVVEIRRRAYSVRTEWTYVQWIRRFIAPFRHRDPGELGAAEVKAFLERLAVQRKVAPSTQNQALCALVFLYREVLNSPLDLGSFTRAKRPRRLPVVLTRRRSVRCSCGRERQCGTRGRLPLPSNADVPDHVQD